MSGKSIDHLDRLWPSRSRFLLGGIVLVLFLLQQIWWLKLAEVVVFAVLAVAAGKRVRWVYFIILVTAIALFNTLSPWGEVLFRIGSYAVTRGSLLAGFTKGLTVAGMVFISLFAVSPHLVLPGRFGALLARTLYYFEQLSLERKKIRRDHLIEDIDRLLERVLSQEVGEPSGASAANRSGLLGALLAVTLVACLAAAAILPARPG